MTLALSPLLLPGSDVYLEKVRVLSAQLDRANRRYEKWDRYYTGDQPLAYLAPEIAQQVGDRLAPLVINWPETIVDTVNRRLQPTGFSMGEDRAADTELWRLWTANKLDRLAPLAQSDALVHGLAFLSVWGNDNDPSTPRMAFESSHQVQVQYVPGSGDQQVAAAIKRWRDDDAGVTFTTLYLPDRIRRYVADTSAAGVVAGGWRLNQELENPLGAVPIVPMVNRGRLLNSAGRSELASIAPIADAINKMATDMMVTSEAYQSPRRYASGIEIPIDPNRRDELRAAVTAFWDEATKKKTWLAGPGVQFGQFPEADMTGFVAAINLLTSAMAAIGGLPPDDLGLNQVNPASAEARRAAETKLVDRAQEKQLIWGGSYADGMALAVAAKEGVPLAELAPDFALLRTSWRDAKTQAIAQEMDAAAKGKAEGIYDTEAAQERVGMDPTERAAMRARQAEAAEHAATADVRARLALADELVATRGLTQNAALAAVGLLQAAAVNSAEAGSSTGTGATVP